MDELFKGFGPFLGRMPMARWGEQGEEFMPLADIVEKDKEYLIKLDLPEVPKDDVKVTFDDGVLTVRGERKVEKEEKGDKVHRTERFYGLFERSFVLPEDVDVKGIRAESREGVLTIHMPRTTVEKARPLAISVQ
jgi:HSP20 family protein